MEVEWTTASCWWGGGPHSPVQHRWESRLLLSAGVDLLPSPGPSYLPAAPVPGTTGQYGASAWVGLGLQLHLSPLAALNFPDLPCLYPLQRLTASLHLCSAVNLPPPPLLAHGLLLPKLVIISLTLPVVLTSLLKTPAPAGTAILALVSHRLRHHSGGKRTPGSRGQIPTRQGMNPVSLFKESSDLLYMLSQAVE